MSSYEITLRAIKGESIERVPVLPLIGAHSAILYNVSPQRAFCNGELMARLQTKIVDYYKPDGVFHYMDLTLEAEALGAKITFKGEVPVITSHVNEINDYEFNEEKGRIKEFIKAIKIMKTYLKDRVFVGAYITGPLTLLFQLFGTGKVMKSLIKMEKHIIEQLDKLTSYLIEYSKVLIEVGADGVMILEPYCSILSPKLFNKVIYYLNKICENISRKNAIAFLHICGNTSHLVTSFCKVRAHVFHIDAQVKLDYARRILQGKCIMGNISTTLFLTANKEKIIEECRRCLEKGGKSYFILSAGCEIPPHTPPENIKAMIKSVFI